MNLNRHTLSRQVAAQVDGLSIQMASAAIDACLESIAQSLASGGSIRLSGFGTFSLRQRKARTTRHPRTQQFITVPAALIPHFTPSIHLRQRVQPKTHESV
jgi:nucleoid DNA-binding protein